MDVFLILFFAISAAVVIVGLFLKIKKIEKSGDIGLIKSDLLEINRSLESMKERVSDRLDQNKYFQEMPRQSLLQNLQPSLYLQYLRLLYLIFQSIVPLLLQ